MVLYLLTGTMALHYVYGRLSCCHLDELGNSCGIPPVPVNSYFEVSGTSLLA